MIACHFLFYITICNDTEMRICQDLFNHLYVCSFVQFLGEGLGNPNKFSELLETSEPETSFKKKVADD